MCISVDVGIGADVGGDVGVVVGVDVGSNVGVNRDVGYVIVIVVAVVVVVSDGVDSLLLPCKLQMLPAQTHLLGLSLSVDAVALWHIQLVFSAQLP